MGSYLQLANNDLHEVTVAGKPLIFHIPSTSLFECDELTGNIISTLRDLGRTDQQSLLSALGQKCNSSEVMPALLELQSIGLISETSDHNEAIGVSPHTPLTLNSLPLTTVVLNVNTGCNLSCSYCYKEDLDVPSAGKKMSFDTAKASIDMLLAESPDQTRYNIVFFGGEPLSNLSLIKQVVAYAEPLFASIGKIVDFSLTTNGTLLSQKVIDFLDAHNIGISVSMDGPKAYHDKNRITVGGQGTYDVVAKKVKLLLEQYKSRPVGVRVTLTKGITDIEGIWDHLYNDLGFKEVGFAPVTSGDIASFNLSSEELSDVFTNMKKLGKKYLEAALKNQNIGFSNLHQLITDLHEGSKKTLPCGAGVGMVAIDHAGDVNLCHRFTGSDLPTFGDIESGIDKPALSNFINARLEQSDKGCSTCQIRNLCAGGCYHESYARYGDPARPTFHYCDLMRDWVDFGISVYTQIMEHNPGFYDTHLAPRRAQS